MSDSPTRCVTSLPLDSPRLFNRPTESELKTLLEPLENWKKFAIFLPRMSHAMIDKIEDDNTSLDTRKLALFSEWLNVDPHATWDIVIDALSKADEGNLASKVQKDVITTIPSVDLYQSECNGCN